jgi:ssDNA-binding replication factor A large subunit
VTVLAEEWTIAYESASSDFELAADETRELVLVLPVREPDVSLVRIEGLVTRGDAGSTGTRPVAGALVQIDGYAVATADAEGRYFYKAVPSTFSGRRIRA